MTVVMRHANRVAAACLAVVWAAAWSHSVPGAQQAPRASRAADAATVLDTYCAGCHDGARRSASGVRLEPYDATRITSSPESWARVYRQLQAGTMPPVGVARPTRVEAAVVLNAIEQALGATASSAPSPKSDDVAARLARMVWNREPDAALRQDAQRDRLRDAAALEPHVRRLLADDRAAAFVQRFFRPWLELDVLDRSDPDRKHFPDFEPSLREALATETGLFLLSQLRDDRDPLELWSADYTFLNEQVARHYGVAGIAGPQFRRVAWSRPERFGLLGHGSVHMVTSRHQHGVDAGYTSPATRSKWVRLHFLGASLPNGFPGAEQVKPELPITPQTRAMPAEPCANCHRNFFPLGYALENFDPLGRWRTHDQAGPVDVSGALVDGTPASGVVEMRQALLPRPDAFRTTITEQLLVYAATESAGAMNGTPETLVRARQILRDLPEPRWSAIIAAVAASSKGDGRRAK